MFALSILPFAVVLFAALVPIASSSVLAALLLRDVPGAGEERARRLVPFRSAAFLVGAVQVQLAFVAGARSMSAREDDLDGAILPVIFGLFTGTVAFAAGGVARRIEDPPHDRSTAWGAALLRLRLVPWFVAPLLVANAAARLPHADPHASLGSRVAWALVAFVVTGLGIAYGGLLLSLATRAFVPAPAAVRTAALASASREGVRLALVLRLPTEGARFANAAAVPWARTVIVTDALAKLLSPRELEAVLAHEAGHISEPPHVMTARLLTATTLVFGFTSGIRLFEGAGRFAQFAALGAGVVLALGLIMFVRRLGRAMEERADARARDTVGAAPLASALRKIHTYAQAPMVTGARRVHPDLYDRLRALGENPGLRPPPPSRRKGLVVGVVLASLLVYFGLLELDAATADEAVRSSERG
jgi:Zn-dependent protease with chaperone function